MPLIHLKRDGTLLFVAAPSGATSPALRRGQALARETGFAGRIAEDLIRRKVEGQLALLDRLPDRRAAKPALERVLAQLSQSTTLTEVRKLEATAAKAYWAAWRTLPVAFVRGLLGNGTRIADFGALMGTSLVLGTAWGLWRWPAVRRTLAWAEAYRAEYLSRQDQLLSPTGWQGWRLIRQHEGYDYTRVEEGSEGT